MVKRGGPKWANVPLDVPVPAAQPSRELGAGAEPYRVPSRERLAFVVAELAAAERGRAEWVVERDWHVAALRAQGTSWAELARLAGTSRQALMKRG